METKSETAQHRLIESSGKTEQLAQELRSGLLALREDLVGSEENKVAGGDVREEGRGLIFRVAENLDSSNAVLGQALELVIHLRDQFAAQPQRAAS